jgi:hypothetical protein
MKMTNYSNQEKRQAIRYLCDDFFSICLINTEDDKTDITAIDFNKEGMGIFSNIMPSESGEIILCLKYENPAQTYTLINLPCTIVHYNQTEVGCHCGVRFHADKLAENDRKALEEIETILSKSDDPEDRYHLFGGE